MPIDISKAREESKRLTLEAQKEYHCLECAKYCRVHSIGEPCTCLFYESNEAKWKKADKPQWKPSKGERYFFVGDNGMVNFTYAEYDEVDEDYYKFGNCFRTEKQADKALEKLRETLIEFHKEIEK